ncbi:MAG: carboxypeptidase-like regulatory domain-containing protein [Anaerolineae bacterium]
MIDEVDARLKTWVENVLGTVDIALTPPRETQTDPVIHLYLLQVVPSLTSPDGKRTPVQIMLHYLVAVRAAEPEQAHKLLGELILAAVDNPDFTLEFDPLPMETWIALGVEPQPAFILKLPLVRERPEPDTSLVRVPMVLRASSIASLQGVVLGPQDTPLYGALVELPDSRLYQRTDSHGRFRFPTVPADPPVKRVRVSAKGHELETEIDSTGEPVVIRLFEENPP